MVVPRVQGPGSSTFAFTAANSGMLCQQIFRLSTLLIALGEAFICFSYTGS